MKPKTKNAAKPVRGRAVAAKTAKAVKTAAAPKKRGRPALTEHQKRAFKGWKTRIANLVAKKLIKDGQPTRKLRKQRSEQAVRAYQTRLENQAAA